MSGLIKLVLVPVEVFGAENGYGLSDAVAPWSDCNRAAGRIYRVDDDFSEHYRGRGETVEVWVKEDDQGFFERRWGEEGRA